MRDARGTNRIRACTRGRARNRSDLAWLPPPATAIASARVQSTALRFDPAFRGRPAGFNPRKEVVLTTSQSFGETPEDRGSGGMRHNTWVRSRDPHATRKHEPARFIETALGELGSHTQFEADIRARARGCAVCKQDFVFCRLENEAWSRIRRHSLGMREPE
ncbi:hypothetical protein BMI87_21070 [Thioclava sp. F28-4]|nr:hypothetical protein BMI87_21070 [Thioclava sp. F28-4]